MTRGNLQSSAFSQSLTPVYFYNTETEEAAPAYSAMIVGFDALHPQLHWAWLVILLLYVLCITSALALGSLEAQRERAPRDDRGLRLGAGLAEGGETGLAYTAFLLLPAWLHVLAPLWIAILFTTVLARTLLAWRILGGSGSGTE